MAGSFGGARASADSNQYLYCMIVADSSEVRARCYARTSAGVGASCTTIDPALVHAIATLDDEAYVEITWHLNVCQFVLQEAGSPYAKDR